MAPASELSIITGRYKSVTIRAMAKARQALSPTREADPLEWLTAELRSRFDDVRDKIPPALDPGKVKDVHHLRVAIRRLHSLLGDVNEIVESPALKHLQKALKKRVNRLGRVRDRDVYIEALEELSSEAGEGKYAKTIDCLIEEDHSERKHAHRKLNRTFSKASNEDLEDQVSSAVKKALEQPGLFRPDSVRSAGHEIVSSRLKDLTELAGDLYDPNDEKACTRSASQQNGLDILLKFSSRHLAKKCRRSRMRFHACKLSWVTCTTTTSGWKASGLASATRIIATSSTTLTAKPLPGSSPNSSRNAPRITAPRSTSGPIGKAIPSERRSRK